MEFPRRPTTQDISWFLDLKLNNQIDLNPPYQRKSVWSPKDKKFFIDTIFRGYPSPAIFLEKKMLDGKAKYFVVDGKQRLETIISFTEDKLKIDDKFGDVRLSGKKWSEINMEPSLADRFWNYVLPVEFINITEELSVNEVFDRLNRNSRRLVDQELRHARWDGWLINFAETEADHSDWKKLGISTATRAKRMKDVQFISELLIVLLKNSVSGFSQEEIDGYYAKYDSLSDVEDEGFNADIITDNFKKTRDCLIAMEDAEHCVTAYAKDFKDFYTLWTVLALNPALIASDMSSVMRKYKEFMEKVATYKNTTPPVSTDSNPSPISNLSLDYYKNSLGASTDLPQREARHNALRAYLI